MSTKHEVRRTPLSHLLGHQDDRRDGRDPADGAEGLGAGWQVTLIPHDTVFKLCCG